MRALDSVIHTRDRGILLGSSSEQRRIQERLVKVLLLSRIFEIDETEQASPSLGFGMNGLAFQITLEVNRIALKLPLILMLDLLPLLRAFLLSFWENLIFDPQRLVNLEVTKRSADEPLL